MRRWVRTLSVVVAAAGCRDREPAGNELRIAAAADLAPAFAEIGRTFEQQTGQRVISSFGSTGQLARQIVQGAPFDLFAAANVAFIDEVARAGVCDGRTRARIGRGRIGVWTRKAMSGAPPVRLEDLTDTRFTKIAIANPEHAPYGHAAREALARAGVWHKVQPRIVYGENIQQTLRFAQTGNVEAALVAMSLARAAPEGDFLLVDETLHRPIDQALIVCARGRNTAGARAFSALVGSVAGRATMKKYGFLAPQ